MSEDFYKSLPFKHIDYPEDFYKPFRYLKYSSTAEHKVLYYNQNEDTPAIELVIPKIFLVVEGQIVNPLEEEMAEIKLLSCAFVNDQGEYTNPLDAKKILIYVGWANVEEKIALVSLEEAKKILGCENVYETENAFFVKMPFFGVKFILAAHALKRRNGSLINSMLEPGWRVRFPCLFCLYKDFVCYPLEEELKIPGSIKTAIDINAEDGWDRRSHIGLYIYSGWNGELKSWRDGYRYSYKGKVFELSPGNGKFELKPRLEPQEWGP